MDDSNRASQQVQHIIVILFHFQNQGSYEWLQTRSFARIELGTIQVLYSSSMLFRLVIL